MLHGFNEARALSAGSSEDAERMTLAQVASMRPAH